MCLHGVGRKGQGPHGKRRPTGGGRGRYRAGLEQEGGRVQQADSSPPHSSLEEGCAAGRIKGGLGAPPPTSTVIALSNKDEAIYIYLIKHHSPLMGHSAFPVCVSQKPISVLKLWRGGWRSLRSPSWGSPLAQWS